MTKKFNLKFSNNNQNQHVDQENKIINESGEISNFEKDEDQIPSIYWPLKIFTSRIIRLQKGMQPITGTFFVQFYLDPSRLYYTSDKGEVGELQISDDQHDLDLQDCVFYSPYIQLDEFMMIVQLDPKEAEINFQDTTDRNLKYEEIRLESFVVLPDPERIGMNVKLLMRHDLNDPDQIQLVSGQLEGEKLKVEQGYIPPFSGKGDVQVEIPNSICSRGPIIKVMWGLKDDKNVISNESIDKETPDPKLTKRSKFIKNINNLFKKKKISNFWQPNNPHMNTEEGLHLNTNRLGQDRELDFKLAMLRQDNLIYDEKSGRLVKVSKNKDAIENRLQNKENLNKQIKKKIKQDFKKIKDEIIKIKRKLSKNSYKQ